IPFVIDTKICEVLGCEIGVGSQCYREMDLYLLSANDLCPHFDSPARIYNSDTCFVIWNASSMPFACNKTKPKSTMTSIYRSMEIEAIKFVVEFAMLTGWTLCRVNIAANFLNLLGFWSACFLFGTRPNHNCK